MSVERWAAVFGALVLLASCGSKSGLLVPGAGAPGGSGGTAGSGGSAGGGGLGAAPTCFAPGELIPERPVGAACAFEGDGALSLAIVSGKRLYGIDGTGIVSTFFQFGQAWPFEVSSSTVNVVESRGGYVAAAVAATPEGETNPTQAVVEWVIVNWAGSLLFHEQRVVSYSGFIDLRLLGDEHGVFALGLQSGSHTELSLAGAHGEHFGPIEGVTPVADPDADGRLCVLREQKHHWLDPCHDTLSPVRAEQIGQYTGIAALGSSLGWVRPSQARAVLETVDTTTELALPLEPEVSLFGVHPSGWLLAASSSSIWSFATANVAEGVAHPLTIAIPIDLHRFGSFGQGVPGFDTSSRELGQSSDSRVLLGLRDASLGHVYASTDGASWQPLGLPVGKVYTLIALERAGTLLIAGTPMGFTADDWAPPPPGVNRIDFQQMQLVRPASGTALVLAQASASTGYVRTYALSADGGCAGTLLDDTLEITSAVSGKATELTLPEFTQLYGAWTFVPGPVGTLGMN